MKLVVFNQKDGDKFAANPDHVANVEQRTLTETIIKMRDGTTHEVAAAFQDVVDALTE